MVVWSTIARTLGASGRIVAAPAAKSVANNGKCPSSVKRPAACDCGLCTSVSGGLNVGYATRHRDEAARCMCVFGLACVCVVVGLLLLVKCLF